MPLAQLIDCTHLHQRLNDANLVLLDCRFALEDPSYGLRSFTARHIQGAHYLNLDHDLSAPPIKGITGRHPLPNPERLSARLRECGVNQDSTLVLYDDDSGAFAAHAWWLLLWLGKTDNLYLLDGGLKAWQQAQLPLTDTSTAAGNGNFVAQVNCRLTLSAEALLAQLNSPSLTLLDARAPARFRGEVEPLDPVAGHIPGAQCAVFTENINADGRFRSPDELRIRFDALRNQRPMESLVAYCGSGVTACHNLFAMALAGYPLAQLYAGSWSEWITDSSRPIATGG